MKRVMIYAYTANNFGDDLFIYILCKRYPNTNFLLYAPKIYERTFAETPNLTVIPSDSLFHKVSRLILGPFDRQFKLRENIAETCDAAIYIGGSLFMETVTWESDLKNIESMMRKGNPFFIIGANFGPYTSEQFYHLYESIFAQCTDVCLRDKKSYTLFQHVPTLRYGSDIAFQLPRPIHLTTKNYIVISVIYPSVRPHIEHLDDRYFQQIKRITETYIQAGYEVVLSGFCRLENDHKAIEQIRSLLPSKLHQFIHTHIYETNIDETIQLLAEAKAIVASRFHAMILGLLFHKPTFPIVYSDKMTTVLNDIGFSGTYWPIEQIEQMDVNDILLFKKNSHANINEEINSSHNHFLLLDQWLNH